MGKEKWDLTRTSGEKQGNWCKFGMGVEFAACCVVLQSPWNISFDQSHHRSCKEVGHTQPVIFNAVEQGNQYGENYEKECL